MAIGVPYDVFWHLTPQKLESFARAHQLKMRMQDEQMWLMGQYVLSAVSVAVEHCLAGKKAKNEYIKNPVLSKVHENDGLTQEERDKRELQKMLLAEEQWAMNDRRRGLPETKIL